MAIVVFVLTQIAMTFAGVVCGLNFLKYVSDAYYDFIAGRSISSVTILLLIGNLLTTLALILVISFAILHGEVLIKMIS